MLPKEPLQNHAANSLNPILEFVRNEPAEKFCSLCILSHYVQHEEDKSVSGNLIADPELDKTRTLKKFYKIRGVAIETDLTYIGIINHLLPRIENGTVKTVVIPDMIKTIMKKQATMHNFIGILNSLIEEGIHEITLRDTRNFGGARINILTSMTPSLLYQNKLMWNRMGFLSRLLPFTYSYTETKKEKIFHAIEKGEIPEPEPINLKLPEFKVEVDLPKDIASRLRPLVESLTESERVIIPAKSKKQASRLTPKGMGFRHQHQLQALLRANALYREDSKVTMEDLREIESLSHWINYDFNPL
jgi:hypothetical protein